MPSQLHLKTDTVLAENERLYHEAAEKGEKVYLLNCADKERVTFAFAGDILGFALNVKVFPSVGVPLLENGNSLLSINTSALRIRSSKSAEKVSLISLPLLR